MSARPEAGRARTGATAKTDRLRVHLVLVAVLAIGAVFLFARLENLPPGQFLDEALANTIARDFAAAGRYPLYVPSEGGGYHPTLIYVSMLARALSGGHVRAARYGIAALSLLSLPGVYAALSAVFRLDESAGRARTLALVGTLITATCVPLVIASRTGAEASLPMLPAALTLLGLAAGLRTERRVWYAAAGAALGAAFYTYYSARLLPVAVTAALAWVALSERPRRWRQRVLELATVGGAAMLVALPLLAYFARNPDVFLARATNASSDLRSGGLLALLIGGLHTLAGLVLPGLGDLRPRHNLPGRPLFDANLAVMLVIGTVVAARRWRRPGRIVLLCWATSLLLPAVLAFEGGSPHFTRLLLAVPALAGLAALGLAAVHAGVARHSARFAQAVLTGGMLFSVLTAGLAVFVRWERHPAIYEAFMVQDWLAADLVEARAASHYIYLSPELRNDPFHATLGLRLDNDGLREFPGPGCLVVRSEADRPQTFITFLPRDSATPARLAGIFPQGSAEAPIVRHPDLAPEYDIFTVPTGRMAAIAATPIEAVFGNEVRLLGYDLEPAAAKAGDTIHLTLYWQALASPLPEWLVFVHAYWPGGETGQAGVPAEPFAQSDGAPCAQAFSTTRWQTGEIVVEERLLNLPPDYAGQAAVLVAGMYVWPSLERLPAEAARGRLDGDRILLQRIDVGP